MLHLPDISVLIQQFSDAERTHRLHLHHQQWVGRDKQISLTWGLGSRSAILPLRSAEFDPGRIEIKASNTPTNYQLSTKMWTYNKMKPAIREKTVNKWDDILLIYKLLMGFYALFTELTPVSSVSVDYTCTTNSATVQWTAVLGAESYRAIAIGDNGTQLMCTSQGTNCRINGLDCGQSYVVHVTPVSESCTNLLNSTSATFQTGKKWLVTKLLCNCHQPDVSVILWNDYCCAIYAMLSPNKGNSIQTYPMITISNGGVFWCLYIWSNNILFEMFRLDKTRVSLTQPTLPPSTCGSVLAHSLLIGQPFTVNANR